MSSSRSSRRLSNTAGFIGGPMVQGFEQDFAKFCESRFCVGVGSGTDALRFAFIAAGIRSGDIVVTVPNTFIATTEAISQAGARPDFVDIDERTYTMDPGEAAPVFGERSARGIRRSKRAFHKRTGSPVTAVVPVHLYGQMADMDPILDLAAQYNLKVIEDACQAHGAEYFSKKEGAVGAKPVRWAMPRRSASILARIWVPAARPGRSRPMTKSWRRPAGCCVTTASQRNTIMTSKGTTGGSMPFRPAFCGPSSVI